MAMVMLPSRRLNSIDNFRTSGPGGGRKAPTGCDGMITCGNLVRIVFLLLVGGGLCAFALAQAADRHTLVLKDGRRIDVDYYEESGDW